MTTMITSQPKAGVTFERFIAVHADSPISGHWGAGETLEAARAKLREARGRKLRKGDRVRAWRFFSELPFAPPERDAAEHEADCFVARDGSINWIRCEREELPAHD